MKAATVLMNRIMRALSDAGVTVWRNNTAQGWAGQSVALQPGQTYKARGGERVVFDAYPIKAGLCVGASDIIGLQSVTITPDMVGKTVAVFCAYEVKSGTGRATKEQANFIAFVRSRGGVAEIVRTEQDAVNARLFED